jgi:hypothetical protein
MTVALIEHTHPREPVKSGTVSLALRGISRCGSHKLAFFRQNHDIPFGWGVMSGWEARGTCPLRPQQQLPMMATFARLRGSTFQ